MKNKMTYQEYLNDIIEKGGFYPNSTMCDPESVDEFVCRYSALFPIGSEHYEQCRKFICETEYINKNRNEYILVRNRDTGIYSFELRSIAEWNPLYIQIVSLAVLQTEDGKIVGVRSTKTDINNKITFVGGHISYENMYNVSEINRNMTHNNLSEIAYRNISKEITEEIGIVVSRNSIDIVAKNIIDRTYMSNHISYYHEPIFFIARISNEQLGWIEMEEGMEPVSIDIGPLYANCVNLLTSESFVVHLSDKGNDSTGTRLDPWLKCFLDYYSR